LIGTAIGQESIEKVNELIDNESGGPALPKFSASFRLAILAGSRLQPDGRQIRKAGLCARFLGKKIDKEARK